MEFPGKKKLSAGLLMYRFRNGNPEVLLVHPGGPYWKNKDEGAWDVPKGEPHEEGDDLLETAKREFEEETGYKAEASEFHHIASVTRKDGKRVEIWAFEGDLDISKIKSNTTHIEWPPKSGEQIEIPEVDRGEFFDLETAKRKAYSYHLETLDAFERFLSTKR